MIKKILISLLLGASCCWLFFNSQNRRVRILSLDGGGIRGVASLEFLAKVQKDTHLKIHENFDVFAGTSTGSIIAVFLALGRDVDLLLQDYKMLSSQVFAHPGLGLIHPKYKQKHLRDALAKVLSSMGLSEDALLRDIPKKVVIPTVWLDNPQTGRSSVYFIENITEEGGKTKIIDAILDSTAAPTYFPSHQGHIDGGIAMNDPSLAAILCAFDLGRRNLHNFSLLSVGTGYAEDGLKVAHESWGVLNWFIDILGHAQDRTPLLSIMMNVESQIPSQACAKLLGNSYKRIDFLLKKPISLDDYKEIPKLTSFIDKFVDLHPTEVDADCAWMKQHL